MWPMIFDLSGEGAPDEESLWMPEVSREMREELFGIAHMVREMEPWKEFFDQDWYGVQDPEAGRSRSSRFSGWKARCMPSSSTCRRRGSGSGMN